MSALLDDPFAEPLTIYFSAAANATRLRLLLVLSQTEERSVSDLANDLRISLPSISTHLKKLRQANLVKYRREAQKNYYFINTDDAFVSLLLRLFEDYRGEPSVAFHHRQSVQEG